MGNSSYSTSDRSTRAFASWYHTKSADEIFEQNRKREIHDSMDPKGVKLREARDSKEHPNSVPIIVTLDVTGSMGKIPHSLVKDGLPHMMGTIIEYGTPDPALLFTAIGDTKCDSYPLQVGQFESGDKELDQWLTRTYLESGGGGNGGESYLLSWYFAAFHTVTDAWEKRKQRGFLFTVGDEKCHNEVSASELKKIMGFDYPAGVMANVLLSEAQKMYDVYHLCILEGAEGRSSLNHWKEKLGDHCIAVSDYENVAKIIADIVVKNLPKQTKKEEKYLPPPRPVNYLNS